MAEKTLRLIFQNSENDTKNVTISVPLCDDTKTGAQIKTAMDVIYTNKAIFDLDLGAPRSAAFVTPLALSYVDLDS